MWTFEIPLGNSLTSFVSLSVQFVVTFLFILIRFSKNKCKYTSSNVEDKSSEKGWKKAESTFRFQIGAGKLRF